MLGKLLLLLVLLAFAAMALIAGMLAPPALQQPVRAGAQALVTALLGPASPGADSTAPAASVAAAGSAAAGSAAAGSAAAGSAAAIGASAAVVAAAARPASAPPWSQLLLPASSAATGARFALLAGQFANADLAQALVDRLQGLGLPLQVVALDDAQGQRWSLVTIGSYAGVDQAEAQRASIATQLGLTTALRVIVLPTKS